MSEYRRVPVEPCPFCRRKLEYDEELEAFVHPDMETICFMSGIGVAEDMAHLWNQRAAAPPADELARLEREIAEKEFWEWCDIWDRGGFDVWFQPSDHHFDVGSMAWYGLKRGLLERHLDNPNLVRVKEGEG